jgi:hypothetical protein
MTDRERMLAAVQGDPVDRIPWIPRLLLWYNARKLRGTLPAGYGDMSLREIERDLGLGTPARDGHVVRSHMTGVEAVVQDIDAMTRRTEYVTPVGTVSTVFRGSADLRANGIADLQVEFMLKGLDDYPVVEYILEHTEYVATYDEYEAYEADIGDEGYPLVSCGDCPFHEWMRALVGYNDAYYHLADHANEVQRLLHVMEDIDRSDVWPLVLDSPARLILHGVHLSSQMTPPPVFDTHITPYYQDFSARLHAAGKYLAMHADNDTTQILGHIERSGFDMVECFVTQPMVSTTLPMAREAWGDRVTIWGAIPSAILEDPYTDGEFEEYMRGVFRDAAPGAAFVLGVADNVMPDAKIERVRRVTEMVEEFGHYPLAR